MPGFSSPAIILRRTDYADEDLIIDLLTLERGRICAIAKNARKSKKRFAGILEPFSCLDAVFTRSAGKSGMMVLKEAAMTEPFEAIRRNMEKAAYASYWSEMVNRWVGEDESQRDLFELLYYAFSMLGGGVSHRTLSILFQIRFLALAGMAPRLDACRVCKKSIDLTAGPSVYFDVAKGGVVCHTCGLAARTMPGTALSKGTIKQFLWVKENDLRKAERVRFTNAAQEAGLAALEAFVVYHLATELKSLKVLRRIRGEKSETP
ncbi:MAG: DNA repair protein RecO [Thermodesulfobacteriota bacterium]